MGNSCYPVPGDPAKPPPPPTPDPGLATNCDNDAICGAGRVCNLGRCEQSCRDDTNCRNGYTCITGRCRLKGSAQCGVVGALCSDDSQCGSSRRCVDQACAADCGGGQCALGQICKASSCIEDPAPQTAQCQFDFDCGGGKGGFRCINAYCLPNCSDSKQCGGGAACVKGTCRGDRLPS